MARSCASPLATGEFAGDPKNLPIELGGTTMKVTDAAGVERLAAIVSASPASARFIVPPQQGAVMPLSPSRLATGVYLSRRCRLRPWNLIYILCRAFRGV